MSRNKYPEEMAELLALTVNFWINPLIFESTPEEVIRKCRLFSSMLAPFGLDILDDEMISNMLSLGIVLLINRRNNRRSSSR